VGRGKALFNELLHGIGTTCEDVCDDDTHRGSGGGPATAGSWSAPCGARPTSGCACLGRRHSNTAL